MFADATTEAAAHTIAAIAGDGIGQEVLPAAREVLDAVAGSEGWSLRWRDLPWGCEWYAQHGEMMPPDWREQLGGTDGIFLGAIGAPAVPDHISLWGLLIPIRRTFDQFVNLRPVRLLPGVPSPVRGCTHLDVAIVRENTEGEYSTIGGRSGTGPDVQAMQVSVFTTKGCERVLRYGFELARRRTGRLVSATKSNGLVHTMPLWDEVTRTVAAEFSDVTWQSMHVDALAARFVTRPQELDVIVASNLFGDIVSDLAAAVAGSLGTAPSANLDPTRSHPSMFEPVHGSAPDIAGRGIANPIGQIWAGAMMLDHLGHPGSARKVVTAIEHALSDEANRPGDLGGTATTRQVTDAVIADLQKGGD
ncbi:MAG: tartrate dehydrogenase [Acidimicrobiales bacterium]